VTAIRRWEAVRPWPVYLLAAFVPLSLAATNVAKLLALLFALVALYTDRQPVDRGRALSSFWTVWAVLALLFALTVSLTYTTAHWTDALGDLGKYSKLLLIPAIFLLLRHLREARIAVVIYLAAQALVVVSSWLLYFDVPIFWASPTPRNSVATVFTSYLDQSMMAAAFAAVCWHLRSQFPSRFGPLVAGVLVAMAVVNVLLMLPGRTGHAALIAVLSLAVFWRLPRRWRVVAVAAPFVLTLAAIQLSPQFKTRFDEMRTEIKSYRADTELRTSMGMRLHFWVMSLEAVAERPVTGYGVGSWHQQFNRLQADKVIPGTEHVRNPHQEFLLWGVQTGIGGMILLLAAFAAMARDAWAFDTLERQAALSVVVVLAVSALFNSVLFDAVTGEFFCISVGLLLIYGAHGRAHHPRTGALA